MDTGLGLQDRCESSMSSVSNISPRQRKTSQLSAGDKTPRKRSSNAGPGLATKRAELLKSKPIVPNKNVGSKLKVNKSCFLKSS